MIWILAVSRLLRRKAANSTCQAVKPEIHYPRGDPDEPPQSIGYAQPINVAIGGTSIRTKKMVPLCQVQSRYSVLLEL